MKKILFFLLFSIGLLMVESDNFISNVYTEDNAEFLFRRARFQGLLIPPVAEETRTLEDMLLETRECLSPAHKSAVDLLLRMISSKNPVFKLKGYELLSTFDEGIRKRAIPHVIELVQYEKTRADIPGVLSKLLIRTPAVHDTLLKFVRGSEYGSYLGIKAALALLSLGYEDEEAIQFLRLHFARGGFFVQEVDDPLLDLMAERAKYLTPEAQGKIIEMFLELTYLKEGKGKNLPAKSQEEAMLFSSRKGQPLNIQQKAIEILGKIGLQDGRIKLRFLEILREAVSEEHIGFGKDLDLYAVTIKWLCELYPDDEEVKDILEVFVKNLTAPLLLYPGTGYSIQQVLIDYGLEDEVVDKLTKLISENIERIDSPKHQNTVYFALATLERIQFTRRHEVLANLVRNILWDEEIFGNPDKLYLAINAIAPLFKHGWFLEEDKLRVIQIGEFIKDEIVTLYTLNREKWSSAIIMLEEFISALKKAGIKSEAVRNFLIEIARGKYKAPIVGGSLLDHNMRQSEAIQALCELGFRDEEVKELILYGIANLYPFAGNIIKAVGISGWLEPEIISVLFRMGLSNFSIVDDANISTIHNVVKALGEIFRANF